MADPLLLLCAACFEHDHALLQRSEHLGKGIEPGIDRRRSRGRRGRIGPVRRRSLLQFGDLLAMRGQRLMQSGKAGCGSDHLGFQRRRQ